MLAIIVTIIVAFLWLLIFSLMTGAKRADEEADRLLAELDLEEAPGHIRGPLGWPPSRTQACIDLNVHIFDPSLLGRDHFIKI